MDNARVTDRFTPTLVTTADSPVADLTHLAPAVVDAVHRASARAGSAYERAWVVLSVRNRPVGILEADLPLDPDGLGPRLRELLDEPVAGAGGDPAEDETLPLPAISVVVPTIAQRLPELRRCLESLTASTYPRYEVVLVDNRPSAGEDTDAPRGETLEALAGRFPAVRVVRQTTPGISAARNAGVAAATGEVVAFTDDDVQVDAHWLHALGRRFATHPDEGVVTGLVVPSELETSAQLRYERHYGGFGGQRTFAPVHVEPSAGPRRGRVDLFGEDARRLRSFAVYGIGAYGAGANMAFRKETLVSIGGFDEALGTGTPSRGGEDLAALVNVLWSGGGLGYEPAALVHHRHRPDEAGLRRQMFGGGVGFTAMLTSLVAHDPRHLLTLAELGPRAVATMAAHVVSRLSPGGRPAAGEPDGAADRPSRLLVALEVGGMPLGALAYLRSRRERTRR